MNTVKNAIYRGQLRTVEDAVESWKCEYEEAEKARDVEAIIAVWLGLAESLLSLQKEALEQARIGKVRKYLELAESDLTEETGAAGD